MSHKPDIAKIGPRNLVPSEQTRAPHSFILVDDDELEPVEVELVDYHVEVEEPQFEALVADSQCEV